MVQSVSATQACEQVPLTQLKPAAQSESLVQGPDRRLPASMQRVMARSPSHPVSHLKPGPHAGAPAAVTSEQDFLQYRAMEAPP